MNKIKSWSRLKNALIQGTYIKNPWRDDALSMDDFAIKTSLKKISVNFPENYGDFLAACFDDYNNIQPHVHGKQNWN